MSNDLKVLQDDAKSVVRRLIKGTKVDLLKRFSIVTFGRDYISMHGRICDNTDINLSNFTQANSILVYQTKVENTLISILLGWD